MVAHRGGRRPAWRGSRRNDARIVLDESGLIPRTQIESAQRTRVAFRDVECDFRTSVSGGAHQWLIVNHAQCLAELTEQRTKVLDDYLKRAQDE
ncbi:lysozyme inhibitor LprI family protein [Burkholderia ubonensis]|uniref:lysozyme inhibitor LprI family protein n=1 Tax=Burkholderia ubonensis TaxID=101571 RepID=UPI0039F55C22